MMLGETVLLGLSITLFAVTCLGLLAFRRRTIRESEAVVVERWGRYHRTLSGGSYLLLPLMDAARFIIWRRVKDGTDGKTILEKIPTERIDLREVAFKLAQQTVLTKDNIELRIDLVLYLEITDPKLAVYKVENLDDSVERLTQTGLQDVVGRLELDAVLAARDDIKAGVLDVMSPICEGWGVSVNRVEMSDLFLPDYVRESIEKENRARRESRAAVVEAEGIKKAALIRADGEARARLHVGKGEAAVLKEVARALEGDTKRAYQYLIAMKYLNELGTLANQGGDGPAAFLPHEAVELFSSLSFKDLFKKEKTTTPQAQA